MIVVAIIAVLASIAYPSYAGYIRKGHRADARAGLQQAAQWLERVATASGTYLTSAASFPNELTAVPSGTYVITYAVPDATGSSYTLNATPQGDQLKDKCLGFTLTHDGTVGLSGSPSTDLIAECWAR
jgi:type IV pilus assembly protein PilE